MSARQNQHLHLVLTLHPSQADSVTASPVQPPGETGGEVVTPLQVSSTRARSLRVVRDDLTE